MASPDSSANESSEDENEKKKFNRSDPSHLNHTVFPSVSSSSAESSSDGSEKTSPPPSNTQHKKPPLNKNSDKISTPSKPSSSVKRPIEAEENEATKPSSKKTKAIQMEDSSAKRPREAEENEATKPSSKKTKAIQMEQKEKKSSGRIRRKKTAVAEVDKSAKKSGPIWNPKDEATFVNGLVASCEKGKGLPKNMATVYDQIRSKLDGEYTTDQLYNKLRGLRAKLGKFRDKVKDEGYSFKNAHEETVYKLSMQVWGKEEDGSEDQKTGKKNDEKVGKRQRGKKHVKEGEGEEREEVKSKHVKDGEGKDREGVKRKLVKDGEVEEREEAKKKHVRDGEGKAREGVKRKLIKDGEGEEREEAKRKLAKDGEGKEREGVKKIGGEGVEMSQKEEEEDGDEDEGEEEDEGEANGNVNLARHGNPNQSSIRGVDQTALHVAESVPNRAGGREKGEEEDVEEEADSSEEEESDQEYEWESSGQENSAHGMLRQSNAGENLVRFGRNGMPKESDARENFLRCVSNRGSRAAKAEPSSMRHGGNDRSNGSRSVAATDQHNPGENSRRHVSNAVSDGSRRIATADQHDTGGNSTAQDPNGSRRFARDDQRKLVDLLCKENSRLMDIFRSEMRSENRDMIDELKHEVAKMVNAALQGSSNTRTDANLEFPINNKVFSTREFLALSDSEIEMLDRKWKTQQLVELEASSKHLALLIEESELRMAKLRNNLSS